MKSKDINTAPVAKTGEYFRGGFILRSRTVLPNDCAEAGRPKSVKYETKAQTRPCLQHACYAPCSCRGLWCLPQLPGSS